MRATIKWVVNDREIDERMLQRKYIHELNASKDFNIGLIELPPFIEPEYKETVVNFKVGNVIDFYIEPVYPFDVILNLNGSGSQRVKHDTILINKLELIFNGE